LLVTSAWGVFVFWQTERSKFRIHAVFSASPLSSGLVLFISNEGAVPTAISYLELEVAGADEMFDLTPLVDPPIVDESFPPHSRIREGQVLGVPLLRSLRTLQSTGPWTYRVNALYGSGVHRSNWLTMPTTVPWDDELAPGQSASGDG
jgi:hypothetical protein